MDCKCNTLIELQYFGGYGHYESTLNSMKQNVKNGYFDIMSENNFEIVFRCNRCKQIWKLGIPDYPVKGYFIRDKKI